MKIFLAQQNYHIGNFDKNQEKIIEAIEIAKSKNGDLIVFSEMSICGYPAAIFWISKILLINVLKASITLKSMLIRLV